MPSIRVASFGFPRVLEPLIGPESNTVILIGALQNPENFGPNGVVKCPIVFLEPVQTILPGSLVNPNGTLNADIFFAGNTKVPLTPSEAAELAAFINAGGIVFVAGDSDPGEGLSYNPLFSALNVTDQFIEFVSGISGFELTTVPVATPVTTGPFGIVGPITKTLFKVFVPGTGTHTVATNTFDTATVLAEGDFGRGYLSVSGDVIYLDTVTAMNQNNLKYFLNLFALACLASVTKGTRGIDIYKYNDII